MKQEFSTVLDVTRWIAALIVVLAHCRHFLFVDYGHAENKTLLLDAIYFVSGLGHEAVVLFFVVSGFLVGGITTEKWKRTGPRFGEYFASRISRIYTVYLPALTIGGAMDWLGWQYFNGAELYTRSDQYGANSLDITVYLGLSWENYFANLVMLGHTLFPILGSNGPLWTLIYEWWYYCFFIFALGCFIRKDTMTTVICVLAMVAIGALMPLHWLIWMLIWLLGLGVYFYCKSSLPRPNKWVALVVFLCALTYSRMVTHNDMGGGDPLYILFLRDLLIGSTYSALIISFYDYDGKIIPFRGLHKWLADFTYSLYLCHFPLLLLVIAALKDLYGYSFIQQPDGFQQLYFFGLVGLMYVYGYIFSLITERHTARVKVWGLKLLGIQPKPRKSE